MDIQAQSEKLKEVTDNMRAIKGDAYVYAAAIGSNITVAGVAIAKALDTIIDCLPSDSELAQDAAMIQKHVMEVYKVMISSVRYDLVRMIAVNEPGATRERMLQISNELAEAVNTLTKQTITQSGGTDEAEPAR